VYHNLEHKIPLLCEIRQHLIISGQNSDYIRLLHYQATPIKDPGWNITLVGCQPQATPVSYCSEHYLQMEISQLSKQVSRLLIIFFLYYLSWLNV
jgi:hypothetical protein